MSDTEWLKEARREMASMIEGLVESGAPHRVCNDLRHLLRDVDLDLLDTVSTEGRPN